MIARTLLIAATALSLAAMPAMAQTKKTDTDSGPHYTGGPKTMVPPHIGKKDTGKTVGKVGPSGSHHYSGGPRSDPHHMGPK
ncbi:hypothetical protein [Bradyrhizobium sp. LMTR 3]|uniref:hypothetical protein n=1 Tax=Bradyrhizobium sp. LMTR 3 TaxID=189873 RepID=UPI0008108F4C|nr:hypothetical protein [Bradyrhizobium sp. LMTR 3]OCK53630.1 hypothetical protein LMTR3_28475 [Bradyrhizobium sp. LMTR 3]